MQKKKIIIFKQYSSGIPFTVGTEIASVRRNTKEENFMKSIWARRLPSPGTLWPFDLQDISFIGANVLWNVTTVNCDLINKHWKAFQRGMLKFCQSKHVLGNINRAKRVGI